MGFDASLPDEVAPGEATALRCKWTTEDGTRCLRVYDHPGMHRTPVAFYSEPEGSGSSSPGEPHKWKNCWKCGHPEHSMKCRVGGTLHFCGCLRLVPAADIAASCREVGGCPEHPADAEAATEPRGSTQSPQDFCGQCRHHRRYHNTEYCEVCPAFTDDYRHTFAPAEPETAGEPCYCGCPEGAHMGRPRGCAEHGFHSFLGASLLPEEGARKRALAAMKKDPEPEAPEEHVCKPGATLYYCPTAGEVESDCHGGFDVCCSHPEQHIQVSPPLGPPPRPPYAIAYELADGTAHEVALPGDATIRLDGGALVITHTGRPIRAMTQNRPLEGA